MVDLKQDKSKNVTPDPDELLLAEVAVKEADPKQPHHHKTPGEKIFDRGVYTGIGFFVNEISSLAITDQFLYGKKRFGKWFCKEGFEELSEKIATAFKIKDKVDPAGKLLTGKAQAGNMILMLTLLSGGTLLVYPMKKMEDNKAYLVEKLNHLVDWFRGNKMSQEEVAERDKDVEKTIACEPKTTWPALLAGRAAAMFSSWATGSFIVGKKNNDKLQNFTEKMFTGSIQAEGQKNMFHRWMSLIGVETYSCAISSGVLEVASKFLAKRGTTVHDPKLCTQTVHESGKLHSDLSPKNSKTATSCKPCMAAQDQAEKSGDGTLDRFKKKPVGKQENYVARASNKEIGISLAT